MLIICKISNPLQLFEDNKKYLSDDILYKYRQKFGNDDLEFKKRIYNSILEEIQNFLIKNERTLADFKDLSLPNLEILDS